MKDSGSDAIQGFCHVRNPHMHTHTQIHSLHFQMTFSLTILSIPLHNFQPFEVSDSPEGRFSSWLRRGIYVLLTLARRAFKVTHISEATRIPFSNVTEGGLQISGSVVFVVVFFRGGCNPFAKHSAAHLSRAASLSLSLLCRAIKSYSRSG